VEARRAGRAVLALTVRVVLVWGAPGAGGTRVARRGELSTAVGSARAAFVVACASTARS